MAKQKIVTTVIDLSNPDKAADAILGAAGSGNWKIVSVSPVESAEASLQESLGASSLEKNGDNPLIVIAVLEEA